MKINWKVRFKNGAFLITFFTLLVTFIYNILGMFGVVPAISQELWLNVIIAVIQVLAGLGVVTDPTTTGVSDSTRALNYSEPAKNANFTEDK